MDQRFAAGPADRPDPAGGAAAAGTTPGATAPGLALVADPDAGTELTRRLCVAAHTDRDFREQVLATVLDPPYRAVAPSRGFDLASVVQHCLRVRRRELWRDLALVAVVLLWLAVAFRVALASVCALVAARLAIRAVRVLLRGGVRRFLGYLVLAVVALAMGSLALQPSVSAVDLLDDPSAGAGYGGGQLFGFGSSRFLGGLALLAATLFAVLLTERLLNRSTVAEELAPQRFGRTRAPEAPPVWRPRLAQLSVAQRGNVTYHAAQLAATPFVGCGSVLGSHLIGVPLQAADAAVPPQPLDAVALQQAVRTRLVQLLGETSGHGGTLVEERLFASGLLAPSDPLLQAEHLLPRHRIPAPELAGFAAAGRDRARPYLVVVQAGGDGGLELSALLSLQLSGGMLHLEWTGAAVPPLRADLAAADDAGPLGSEALLRLALAAARDVAGPAPRAPWRLLQALGTELRRRHLAGDRSRRRRGPVDYGATTAVRQLAGEPELGHFQRAEAERSLRQVGLAVRTAVADVLAGHGYRSEEFRARAGILVGESAGAPAPPAPPPSVPPPSAATPPPAVPAAAAPGAAATATIADGEFAALDDARAAAGASHGGVPGRRGAPGRGRPPVAALAVGGVALLVTALGVVWFGSHGGDDVARPVPIPGGPAPATPGGRAPVPLPSGTGPSAQREALGTLARQRSADVMAVQFRGQWVAEVYAAVNQPLATEDVAPSPDPATVAPTAILARYAALVAGDRLGPLYLLQTSDYGLHTLYRGLPLWVVVADGGFATEQDVRDWCARTLPEAADPTDPTTPGDRCSPARLTS